MAVHACHCITMWLIRTLSVGFVHFKQTRVLLQVAGILRKMCISSLIGKTVHTYKYTIILTHVSDAVKKNVAKYIVTSSYSRLARLEPEGRLLGEEQ